MSKYLPHSYSRRFLLLLSCFLIILLSATITSLTQGNCVPKEANRAAWPQGATIYVNFGNLNTEQRRQVQLAIDAWNTSNQSNGAFVAFSTAAPPAGARTLNFQIGQTHFDPSTGQTPPAETQNGTNDANGNRTTSTIVFSNTVTAVGTDGVTPQLAIDETTSSDIFTKVALHEMGHTMGLGETTRPGTGGSGVCGNSGQRAGTSVMNGECGANDWGGNMPTTVPGCDSLEPVMNF